MSILYAALPRACCVDRKNASLEELTSLIKTSKKFNKLLSSSTASAGSAPDLIFSFCLVYPDRTGKHVLRKVGQVQRARGSLSSSNMSDDHAKTLSELKLEIGDYLDVAVIEQTQTADG